MKSNTTKIYIDTIEDNTFSYQDVNVKIDTEGIFITDDDQPGFAAFIPWDVIIRYEIHRKTE
jgi:hypothetical protein